MVRRYVALLLVLGLVTGVLGCAQATQTAAGGTIKVGFIPQTTRANYAVEMAEGFRDGVLSVGGVEAVVNGPELVDGPAQLTIFNQLTATSIKGIGVHTAFGDLFAQPMADAAKRNIPVVSVDSRPPPSSDVQLYVGNDNQALGVLLADLVLDKLPSNAVGTIVIGSTTPGTHALDQRSDAMRAQIRKRLPAVKVVGPFETKRDPKVNHASWAKLVRAYPKALAFLGTGNFDAVSLGALRVSTKGMWQAGAFDLEKDALAAVKAGQLVLVSPEHFLKGAIAGHLLARHAKDGTALPKGWILIPGLAITQSNIDAIVAREESPTAKQAYIRPLVEKIINDPTSLHPL